MKRTIWILAAIVLLGWEISAAATEEAGVAPLPLAAAATEEAGVAPLPLAAAATEKAKATLVDAKGNEMGRAALTETAEGVKIFLQARGIPHGTHALHIHAVGKCDPPDFKSAGPHFNPYGKKHGAKNPQGAHAGDLPNILVGAMRTIQIEVLAKGVTLVGTGENSLFHEGGTSLVIHADADDEATDPAGNAGARIACGVITR